MKFRTLIGAGVAAGAFVVSTGIAGADWNIDADGNGFVGKGDVQLALGLNNKQLQEQASSLEFTVSSTTVSEATWTCDKDSGPQTQERASSTTTSVQGVVSSVARVRNQITGFHLTGFEGTPTTSEEREGPRVGSCATNWTAINLVEGDPVPVGESGLFVNGVALPDQTV